MMFLRHNYWCFLIHNYAKSMRITGNYLVNLKGLRKSVFDGDIIVNILPGAYLSTNKLHPELLLLFSFPTRSQRPVSKCGPILHFSSVNDYNAPKQMIGKTAMVSVVNDKWNVGYAYGDRLIIAIPFVL